MDLNNVSYDDKFQEMQKYIPFLNDIIDKLENVSGGHSQSNLRGIQLSKINSLKSLLSDKTKRMKIENLLRCEDILKKLKDKVGMNRIENDLEETQDSIDSVERPIDIDVPSTSVNLNFYKEYSNEQEILKPIPPAIDSPDSESCLSNFEECRKKLREITKVSINENTESTSHAKPLEKEIQLVTNAYIQSYSKIELLSKVISESLDKITRSKPELFDEGNNKNIMISTLNSIEKEEEKSKKKNISPIKFPDFNSEHKNSESPKDKWRKNCDLDYKHNSETLKNKMKKHFDNSKDSDKTEFKKRSKKDKNKEKDSRHKHKKDNIDSKTTKEKVVKGDTLKDKMKISEAFSLSALLEYRNVIKKELEDVKDISLDVTDFKVEDITTPLPKDDLPKEDGEIGESEEEQELVIDMLYTNINDNSSSTKTQSIDPTPKVDSFSDGNINTLSIKDNNHKENIIKFNLKKSDDKNKVIDVTNCLPKCSEQEDKNTLNLAIEDAMESLFKNKTDLNPVIEEQSFLTIKEESKPNSVSILNADMKICNDKSEKLKNNLECKESPLCNAQKPDCHKEHCLESKSSKLEDNKGIPSKLDINQLNTNKAHTTFEQDVLEALNDELKDVSTGEFDNFLQGQRDTVHQEIKKIGQPEQADKKLRRISFEKYKEKINSCSADAQISVTNTNIDFTHSRGLTPKEIERFNINSDKYKDPLDVFSMPKLNKSYIIPKKEKNINSSECIASDNKSKWSLPGVENHDKIPDEKHDQSLLASKTTTNQTFKTNLHTDNRTSLPHEKCDVTGFIDVQNQFKSEFTPNNAQMLSEYNQNKFITFNKFLAQEDNVQQDTYLPARQIPILTNRFNVNYPVSANYRGKNPKPLLGMGFYNQESKIIPENLTNTKPASPLHSIKVTGESSFEEIKHESNINDKRGNYSTANPGFKNIIKCESIKELSLHKSAKAKHTYSAHPSTSRGESPIAKDKRSTKTFNNDPRKISKAPEATVHGSYPTKKISISKQDPRLNKIKESFYNLKTNTYEDAFSCTMNKFRKWIPSILSSLNSYIDTKKKAKNKRFKGDTKTKLADISEFISQKISEFDFPNNYRKLPRKDRKKIRHSMKQKILYLQSGGSSSQDYSKEHDHNLDHKELSSASDSDEPSCNLICEPDDGSKSSMNSNIEENIDDSAKEKENSTCSTVSDVVDKSRDIEIKDKVNEPSESLGEDNNIIPDLKIKKEHVLISNKLDKKIEFEQFNMDTNSSIKGNETRHILDNIVDQNINIKSEETKVDNSHFSCGIVNDSDALNSVVTELNTGIINKITETNTSNTDINHVTKVDKSQVDNTSDIKVKEKPENVVETTSDCIEKSVVNSLVDVLKDKQKMLEMLSLLSQNGEDIPLKIKKKIQLLAELESDDESETMSTKSETMSTKSDTYSIKSPRSESVEGPSNASSSNVKDKSKNKPNPKKNKPKTRWRNEVELLKNSLPEMFINQGGLQPTGIRMCRLAREFTNNSPSIDNTDLGRRVTRQNEKKTSEKKTDIESSPSPEKIRRQPIRIPNKESELRIVVTKLNIFKKNAIKEADDHEVNDILSKYDLKPCPKIKKMALIQQIQTGLNPKIATPDTNRINVKPCPKSKKTLTVIKSGKSTENKILEDNLDEWSDADDSLPLILPLNNKKTFTKTPILKTSKISMKKKKKGVWCKGTVKKRNRRKKIISDVSKNTNVKESKTIYADYHFSSNISTYPCKYCNKIEDNIVNHYIKAHPHKEILISRLSGKDGSEAIADSNKNVTYNFLDETSNNYQCRFCHMTFVQKRVDDLYEHVKFLHTGEYEHDCKVCGDLCTKITLPNDKSTENLAGYICSQCNYTQISRENVETHVAAKHENEICEIFQINLMKLVDAPKVTRSSANKESPEKAITPPIQINSEANLEEEAGIFSLSSNACMANELNDITMSVVDTMDGLGIKEELLDIDHEININDDIIAHSTIKTEPFTDDFNNDLHNSEENLLNMLKEQQEVLRSRNDHALYSTIDNFTINNCCVGGLEVQKKKNTTIYLCKINECIFQTDLFLTFQRHVETDHINDLWNGYCTQCFKNITKVPVTFSCAIEHMINEHVKSSNDFLLDAIDSTVENINREESNETYRPKINIRSIDNLFSVPPTENHQNDVNNYFPRIESVVSLKSENAGVNNFYSEENSTQKDIEYTDDVFNNPETHEELPNNQDDEDDNTEIKIQTNTHLECQSYINVDNNLFICYDEVCAYSSNTMDEFVRHLKKHSSKNKGSSENSSLQRTCIYCKYISDTDEEIGLHISKEHGHCKYKCNDCFYRGASYMVVCAHSVLMHPKTKDSLRVREITKCLNIENKILTAGILSKNVVFQPYVCTAKKDVICVDDTIDICDEKFYLRNEFLNHVNKRHKSEKLNCQICHSYIMSVFDLLMHYSSHHHFNIFKCSYCINGADSRILMLHHLINNHPNRSPIFYCLTAPENKNLNPKILKINLNSLTIYHMKKIFGFSKELTIRSVDIPKTNKNILAKSVIEKIPKSIERIEAELTVKPSMSKSIRKNEDVNVTSIDNDNYDGIPSKRMKFNESSPNNSSTKLYNMLSSGYKNILNDENWKDDDDELGKEAHAQIRGLNGRDLFICGNKGCDKSFNNVESFTAHVFICKLKSNIIHYECFHCHKVFKNPLKLISHILVHGDYYECIVCKKKFAIREDCIHHLRYDHPEISKESSSLPKVSTNEEEMTDDIQINVKSEKDKKIKKSGDSNAKNIIGKKTNIKQKATQANTNKDGIYGPNDITKLPLMPILMDNIHCAVCKFSTKVTSNMARHLQLHTSELIVPAAAPVNPVPHLKSNEKHFDKMINLALSSYNDNPDNPHKYNAELIPKLVPSNERYVCGAPKCHYISINEGMLHNHWDTLHKDEARFYCVHCKKNIELSKTTMTPILAHLRLHGPSLYRCCECDYVDSQELVVNRHIFSFHKIERASAILIRSEKPKPLKFNFVWHCGFCSFKADKKAETVDHCKNAHNVDMQLKCGLCRFSSNTKLAINIHHGKKHRGESASVVRTYYRKHDKLSETITPIWWQQRKRGSQFVDDNDKSSKESTIKPPFKKVKIDTEVESFTNLEDKIDDTLMNNTSKENLCDIDYIKDLSVIDWTSEEYYCNFCKKFISKDVKSMEYHLYEDLNYRKWQCNICKYKSFNPDRVNEHSITEHRISPKVKTLNSDMRIENWVSNYIALQTKNIAVVNGRDNIDSAAHPSLLPDNCVQEPKDANQPPSDSLLCSENYSSDEERLVICDNEVEATPPLKSNIEQFICNLCGFIGKNINLHNVKKHFRPCKCQYCNYVSADEVEMFNHHNESHEEKEFKIKNVPSDHPEVPSTSKLITKPVSKSQILVCIICKTCVKQFEVTDHKLCCFSEFSTNTVLNRVSIVKKCTLCTKLFPDDASMSLHFKVHHDDVEVLSIDTPLSKEIWQHTTSKKVNVKSVLNALSSKEERQDNFACAYCNRGFTKYYGYSRHHFVKHRENSICFMPLTKRNIQDSGEVKKTFNLTDDLYECVVMTCRETFSDATSFGAHIKEHYCVFKCAKCSKSFNLNEPYSDHCETHHSNIDATTLKNICLFKEEEVFDRIKQIEVLLNIILSRRSENVKTSETPIIEKVVESPNAFEKKAALPKPKQVARKSTTQIAFYT